jgi:hypothetical protein
MHHHPDQEIQKCASCQQSDERYGGWGLLVISTGYCAMPEEELGHTVHNKSEEF